MQLYLAALHAATTAADEAGCGDGLRLLISHSSCLSNTTALYIYMLNYIDYKLDYKQKPIRLRQQTNYLASKQMKQQ